MRPPCDMIYGICDMQVRGAGACECASAEPPPPSPPPIPVPLSPPLLAKRCLLRQIVSAVVVACRAHRSGHSDVACVGRSRHVTVFHMRGASRVTYVGRSSIYNKCASETYTGGYNKCKAHSLLLLHMWYAATSTFRMASYGDDHSCSSSSRLRRMHTCEEDSLILLYMGARVFA